MNLNLVQCAGNLVRDPEVKYTPKGTAICQFTVAINRKWKSESGETKEDVAFVDCEAWGKTAETIAQYMKKGRCLYVQGRLQTDTWEDKQSGQKRSKLKVVCESFQFVGGPKDSDTPSPTPGKPVSAPAKSVVAKAETKTEEKDDDSVPF